MLEILQSICVGLGANLSLGVFRRKQYIISKLDTQGHMWYCSCHFNNKNNNLEFFLKSDMYGPEICEYKHIVVDISNPNSIEIIKNLLVPQSMFRASKETETKIIKLSILNVDKHDHEFYAILNSIHGPFR